MADKVLTWEEKVEQGIKLNDLERVKYDATRITLRRIREEQEEKKAKAEQSHAFDPLKEKSAKVPAEVGAENSKKGN